MLHHHLVNVFISTVIVILANELRTLLANHEHRPNDIDIWKHGDDAAVDDAQPIDPVRLQARVNDAAVVLAPHARRA